MQKTFKYNDHIKITHDSYLYVNEYKKQLLGNVTKLLNDCKIKFVIAHGNLIEFTRGEPILHDDDIDIRFDVRDMCKWYYFSMINKKTLYKYNLNFDDRFRDIEAQKYNGIQCRLIKFKNLNSLKVYDMDIHCDLVASSVGMRHFWKDYDIVYSNRRRVQYLNIFTFAPSEYDTHKVLLKDYGKNYLIPDR